MVGEFPRLNWHPWQASASDWDRELARFPDHAYPQSYGWGEHKTRFGWTPHRLAATEDGRTVAMAQLLVRRFPMGVAIAWAPGGPIGSVESWGPAFLQAGIRAISARHLYLRINPMREHEDWESRAVASVGWRRPKYPMLSGQSIILDLRSENEEWLGSIDAGHRYYVRKSASAGLRWVHGNTEPLRRDLVRLTGRLQQEKRLVLEEANANALESLSQCLPDSVLILIGYSEDEPVTGCAVLLQHRKAYYATAATVGHGRKVSAAYCMVYELRSLLRRQGMAKLDFGGINPASGKARGVDHFKRGFGGRQIRYLGEWEWATSPLLRLIADALIGRRARIV